MKVLLLGHGYIAHALAREIHARNWMLDSNERPCSKMTTFRLHEIIQEGNYMLVINAAAYIPPSGRVADCAKDKDANIFGNTVFPQMVANACDMAVVPMIHISTGCIFDEVVEYTENDEPTRGWNGDCGDYVGAKLLGERLVREAGGSYILRLRLPFDEISHHRNYLNKLMTFPTVYRHTNSLTHRGEFAKAALDLFEFDAPYGTYHVANQGQISAEQLCEKLFQAGIMRQMPNFIYHPTTGCRLSTNKLSEAGIILRPVEEAVDDAIRNWTGERNV